MVASSSVMDVEGPLWPGWEGHGTVEGSIGFGMSEKFEGLASVPSIIGLSPFAAAFGTPGWERAASDVCM